MDRVSRLHFIFALSVTKKSFVFMLKRRSGEWQSKWIYPKSKQQTAMNNCVDLNLICLCLRRLKRAGKSMRNYATNLRLDKFMKSWRWNFKGYPAAGHRCAKGRTGRSQYFSLGVCSCSCRTFNAPFSSKFFCIGTLSWALLLPIFIN